MNLVEKSTLCILTLVGIPGSGKTSFSSFLARCLSDGTVTLPFSCIIHVCYDAILVADGSVEWNRARQLILTSVNQMIEKLKRNNDLEVVDSYSFKTSICSEKFTANPRILIIIDDNMYYKSMRYKYYQIARNHQLSYCQLYLKCDVQECIKRNSARNFKDVVPESVIIKMFSNLEEPNSSSSWESFSLTVDSTEDFQSSVLTVCKMIDDAFTHPILNSVLNVDECPPQVTSSSFLHHVDILLRKIVGSIISNEKHKLTKIEIRKLSLILNSNKQVLLHEIKLGQFFISDELIKGITDCDPQATIALDNLLRNHLNQSVQNMLK